MRLLLMVVWVTESDDPVQAETGPWGRPVGLRAVSSCATGGSRGAAGAPDGSLWGSGLPAGGPSHLVRPALPGAPPGRGTARCGEARSRPKGRERACMPDACEVTAVRR